MKHNQSFTKCVFMCTDSENSDQHERFKILIFFYFQEREWGDSMTRIGGGGRRGKRALY